MEKKIKIKPALLVIDIQHAYLKYIPEKDREFTLNMINMYIGMFREYDYPLIRIYHSNKEQNIIEGSPEFEFPDNVMIKPDDPQVIKTYPDAFNKTHLNKILKEFGCNTLLLSGLSSVGCVLATWIGAFNHDYKAFLVKDAIMCHRKDYTNNVEVMFEAAGHAVIQLILEGGMR